jgi:hypothetical protein
VKLTYRERKALSRAWSAKGGLLPRETSDRLMRKLHEKGLIVRMVTRARISDKGRSALLATRPPPRKVN